ncbi:MAG: hypothetical protein N3A59_08855 [Thermodesulfovibrionales bacterium]|nr:hypothetical protein [Thermodesulfovibrionales bacterium]
MSSFGAGFDEKCYNYNSSSKLYERDIKEVPKPIDYKIKKLYLNKPVNKVFIVCCDLDMEISLKLFSQDKPSKTKYGFGKT